MKPAIIVPPAALTAGPFRQRLRLLMRLLLTLAGLAAGLPVHTAAQNVLTFDAAAPAPAPVPVAAKPGTARNPQGVEIGVNSQYLTLGGEPWLPVMGEFHYSRYPEAEWEQEILKMKAAGVQIISTYVIWIHQEQTEGVFDWTGQRDLRRFVQLCGRHGMYVFPRIGPWSHAEVRNGGLPDWVLKNSPVRQNNPVYLSEVQSFYTQIAQQIKGLLWKDGGPVIGIQIENEYGFRGPGKGDEHIRTLKSMAVADGLDVPLYTVTGWDGAAIPLDAALPVFGGYPAAPWSGDAGKLPPSEVYAFRFNNRAAGSMGAIGGSGQSGASAYQGTPFLTAEVGAGAEDTYFRRPVLSPDDIAAIAPVMLGSGVNLLGYYMFQGGRNPDGGDETLQESQRTGYPTDVPVRSYDFQAPLGEFGQVRESLRKLKLIHYFLNDFGTQLAPMPAHTPDRVPASPADTSVPRVALRSRGDAGFLFLNNYVRGLQMPERPGFQAVLKLPSGILRVPEQPIDLPSGVFGIWPVNLPLTGATAGSPTLRYSTAQLFKRIRNGQQTFFFFTTLPGVQPEFLLSSDAVLDSAVPFVESTRTGAGLRLRPASDRTVDIRLRGGVHVVLLPEPAAEQVWRVDDPTLLLSTAADAFSDGSTWTLQSTGQPKFDFSVFGSPRRPSSDEAEIEQNPGDALFLQYHASLPPIEIHAQVTLDRAASQRPPPRFGPALSWRPTRIPLAPDTADFAAAAVWTIRLSTISSSAHLSDVFLTLRHQGDVARLSRAGKLLDDNFWNGEPWSIGLKELGGDWREDNEHLTVAILPLPKKLSIYLQTRDDLLFDAAGVAGALTRVEAHPQYQLVLHAPPAN